MQKGVVMGSRDLLLEIQDHSISRERLKLETSNLAGGLDTGGTNDKKAKIRQHGREQGHVTYFLNFGTPQSGESND